MPKNSSTRKRRTHKRRSTDSVKEADLIERSRLADPNNPSICIEMISDMNLHDPVKTEEVSYPNTRFQCSTTLFPAMGVEEKCLSETTSEIFKRYAEDELTFIASKKLRVSDSSKPLNPIISDDCMIIEKPKKQVEVIDLTEDSHSIVPVLCSPVKTSYLENRPGEPNTTFQSNGDVRIKAESGETTCEVNGDAVGVADMNYHSIQSKAEQNEVGENNSEVNTIKFSAGINKNINSTVDNPSHIQVKTEKIMPIESINEVSYDESSFEPRVCNNHVHIKAEKSNSSENITEINLEKSHAALGKDSESKIYNIDLRSGLNKENEDSRRVNGQVTVSNTVSACIAKNGTNAMTSGNHQFNDVSIKVEQNENQIVIDSFTSLSNLFSDASHTGINSVDHPVKSEQNKTNEKCEVGNNYMSVPNPPSVCCTELETEHVSKLIKKQTDEKIKDWVANCLVSNEEVQENVICDENKKNVDPSFNYLLTAAQVRSEPQEMDFQDNSCNYEKPQNCQDVLQERTETLVRDELNRISISPITDVVNFAGELDEPGTFRTPLLRYLNCNMKVGILEISHVLSALNEINGKEEINIDCNDIIESDVIPDSIDSQVELKLCSNEKREQLTNLGVNEKQSLEVDEILHKTLRSNLKESVNFKQNVTNPDSNPASSSNLEKSINERQAQNILNSDGLSEEMRQNNSPNIVSEYLSKNESNREKESDSYTIFNSPVDNEIPLEDNCSSVISLLSLDGNKLSETSNNLPIKVKENTNEKLLSSDFLRQILGNAKSTEKSDDFSDISSSLEPSVHSIVKSNIIINENVFQNLREIRLIKNNAVESTNSTSNADKKNSEHTVKNSESFSKSLLVPNENAFKRGVIFDPSITYGEVFGTPPKRVKIFQDDSISKSGNVKKLSCKRYKRGSPHYPTDHLNTYRASEFLSNSFDSSQASSNFEQNMLTPPRNSQNRSLPIYSDESLLNPGYCHMINAKYFRDPRLAPNCSPTLYRDVNSHKQLGSFNISQTRPPLSVPEASKSSIRPRVKQTRSVSTTNAMRNSSSGRPFHPTVIAMEILQGKQVPSENSSFHPSDLNHRTSEENNRFLLNSSTSESSSFPTTRHNPHQLVQDVEGHQPLLPVSHLPGNASSLSSENRHLMSQEIRPLMSRHSALTHDHYSTESVHGEFILDPPLSANSPPPFPPTPPCSEESHSLASDCSEISLLQNHKKLVTTKSSSSEFISASLLPKHLREAIGKKIIHSNYVYLIIIEINIDRIHGIDKEFGREFLQVRDNYANHLMYYNTYFPLLLLEFFSKICTTLKGTKAKEKIDKNICKIVHCETEQSYVSFTCDSFIRHTDMENIPKAGHIILVKFATIHAAEIKRLGYVFFSATRAYSHKHDYSHDILKYVNGNKRTDMIKIKIKFYTVFTISGINLDLPIEVSKLTNIKKVLMLNNALQELLRSPLCNSVLSPRNHNFKSVTLPRRQDTNTMTSVVQGIVQSLNPSSPQLIVIKSAPFTDSFLAIVQIIEEIKKSKIAGKILVCVRMEMLSQMGMNLVETSSNVIIINKERENVHEKLKNRVLDVMISDLSNAQNIPDDVARSKVLQEADVLLAVTGTCFYEDVKCMARDLTYCIIHDAHSFTEPESLLPLLYGIRHLLLFGDPEESCYVSSKRATSLGYNRSLFHRACNLC